MEAIKRQIFVLRDTLKEEVDYVIGTNMIPIEYHVMDFSIPVTATAVVYVLRSDGRLDKILADIKENVISFMPDKKFFAEGTNTIRIRVVNDNKTLISFVETVKAVKGMRFDDDAEVQQGTLIEQVLTQVGELTGTIKTEIEDRKKAIQEEETERKKVDETKANKEDLKQHAFRETVKTFDATEEGYAMDAVAGRKLKKQIDAKCATATAGGYNKEWKLTNEYQPIGNYTGMQGENDYYKAAQGRDGYLEVKESGVYLIVLQANIKKRNSDEYGMLWSKITQNDSSIGGDVHYTPKGSAYDTLNFVTYNYLNAGTRLKAFLAADESITDVWSSGEDFLNVIKLS